jgi:hypothetical protein
MGDIVVLVPYGDEVGADSGVLSIDRYLTSRQLFAQGVVG